MPYEFISISCQFPEHGQQQLNQFISTHRIATVDKQFVADGSASHWSFCLEYLTGNSPIKTRKERIDYREKLNDADFQVFARLRELRKKLAHDAGVPPYGVFTDQQMAEFVESRVRTLAAMEKVSGVGEARLKAYGSSVLELIVSLQSTVQ